jgi:SAM-dependent methyltransferase
MKRSLVRLLACPACGHPDLQLRAVRTERRADWTGVRTTEVGDSALVDVLEGALECVECHVAYPIRDGVPRMMPPDEPAGPATGHRWTEFDDAVPEYEQNFRELCEPLGPTDFVGRVVLAAGCGFGRHAFFAARYGAEVVALDSSAEAVASAAKNLSASSLAHVVQGDIARPPLRRDVFDIVYSFGVLHHVVSARRAFASLRECVRPGGRLLVWVYGPRQGLIRIVTGALRGATAEMRPEHLYRFSQALALGVRTFSHAPYRVLRRAPGMHGVVTHLPLHDHARWPFGIVVADVYDRLRVPVTGYFTGEELEKWYAEAGFADIDVLRRVRNTESFRGSGVRR